MRESFIKFIESPDLESFLEMRGAVMAAPGFDPYSSELLGIDAMMEEEKFELVVETISEHLFPNHFLSPGAHFRMGFAHHKCGRSQEAEMEHMIYYSLLQGIELTGDGSEANPFLVSRTSDEHDYVYAHELTFQGQALMSKDDKTYDQITVTERDPIWFDITEIYAIMQRQFGG